MKAGHRLVGRANGEPRHERQGRDPGRRRLGTALALTAARAGHEARLWARDAETVRSIVERRENPRYLPGIRFNEPVEATGNLGHAVGGGGGRAPIACSWRRLRRAFARCFELLT